MYGPLQRGAVQIDVSAACSPVSSIGPGANALPLKQFGIGAHCTSNHLVAISIASVAGSAATRMPSATLLEPRRASLRATCDSAVLEGCMGENAAPIDDFQRRNLEFLRKTKPVLV